MIITVSQAVASLVRMPSGARLQGRGERRRRSHRHVGDGRGCQQTHIHADQPTRRASRYRANAVPMASGVSHLAKLPGTIVRLPSYLTVHRTNIRPDGVPMVSQGLPASSSLTEKRRRGISLDRQSQDDRQPLPIGASETGYSRASLKGALAETGSRPGRTGELARGRRGARLLPRTAATPHRTSQHARPQAFGHRHA